MKLRHLLMAASALILASCATSTPYQPASELGAYDGFSQTMIENDRARVTFAGNSVTERETVENYLLYRAAEIATERGFEYFTLVERDTEKNTRLRSTGSSLYDPYFGYSFYRPRFGWSSGFGYSDFGGFNGRRGGRGFGHRGFGFGSGFAGDPFFNNYDVREITKYRATAEVKFGRGTKPGNDNAFSAREVLENLGPTITYPEVKS
ncbi:hypothetical protein N9W89_04425 [Hellea sp.]|nr:hypothetical protein [Hellea sp.]